MKRARCGLFFACLCLFGKIDAVFAQSTIFNVPTTDIVAKGKVYFEFDFQPQLPEPSGSSRIVIYDPRLVVGLAPNVEAGINVASFHQPDTTEVLLQPNLKWRFFNNDSDGIAAAAGGILYSPANHRDTL